MKNISLLVLLIFIGIIALFFYSVGSILTPFITSMIIAYFLDPLTKKVARLGLKRSWTVMLIVGLFSCILVIGFLKLIPALFAQIHQFIMAIPQYEEYVSKNLLSGVAQFLEQFSPEIGQHIKNQLSGFSTQFFKYVIFIITNIFNSSIAILNIIALILFTPILVFYLLRDWSSVVKSINNLLPLEYKDLILDQLNRIDKVLSAYIRGQINVCLIMSLFYVISLSILGLNYALLIGIIIGTLTIIPYLGVVIGLAICGIVALLQFSDLMHVYITVAIFVIGHLLEGYYITPKFVGEKVGLHPVWVIFALMAGGALFGFWGMFFAIPVAATIGVLFRCLLKIYFASNLYNKSQSSIKDK